MIYFWQFITGFALSMLVITAWDFEGHEPLSTFLKYIGFGVMFGILYVEGIIRDKQIKKLEKEIKELKDNSKSHTTQARADF